MNQLPDNTQPPCACGATDVVSCFYSGCRQRPEPVETVGDNRLGLAARIGKSVGYTDTTVDGPFIQVTQKMYNALLKVESRKPDFDLEYFDSKVRIVNQPCWLKYPEA